MTPPAIDMKVKLLHIIPSMNIGGREKVVLDLVDYIDKSKFEVEIACLGSEGTFHEKFKKLHLNLHFFNKHPGFDVGLFGRLKKLIVRGKYQVVHCHNPGALIYGSIGAMFSGVSKIINTEHGYGTEISKRKVLLETVLRNKIYATVAVSDDLKRKLCEHSLANPKKIVTIHNGIPCYNSQPIADKAAVKKSLGIDAGDFVVGTVGRLEAIKDQKTLLEGFNIFQRKRSDTKLVIVGDGKERRNLHKTASSLNLDRSIVFTGERNDVDRLLRSMDAFILPSLSEGISITLLEAMRAGTPVIATSVGGNVEIVENNTSGFLIPHSSPGIIADKLFHLMESREVADSMRINAERRIQQHFNIVTCAEKYESLYLGKSRIL